MGRRRLDTRERNSIEKFVEWNKDRWDLKGSMTGETLELKEGEEFIPVWLPEKRTCNGLYVSRYGNIISFKKQGEWLQGTVTEKGYFRSATGRHHRIVFYSFWADAIKRLQKKYDKKDIRHFFMVISGDNNAKIGDLNELVKYAKNNDLVVHHKDHDRQNNEISNLQLLDKDTHDNMENGKYDEIAMNAFILEEEEKRKVIVRIIEEDELVKEMQEYLWG